MTQPPIFIMKTAQEGVDAERKAVLSTLERWADEMSGSIRLRDASQRVRTLANIIRRGEHHRPIDTAPRRRMAR